MTHQQWHNLFYGEGDHGILCGDGDILTELGESTKLLHLIVVAQHCHNGLRQRTGKRSSEARKGLQGRLLTQSNAVLFSSQRAAGNRAVHTLILELPPLDGYASSNPAPRRRRRPWMVLHQGWEDGKLSQRIAGIAQTRKQVLWLEIGKVACLCWLWP